MKALLAAVFLVLATQAGANCVGGPLNALQLSDGRWLAVTARDGDRITTAFEGAVDGQKDVAWQGVIPLVSDNGPSLIEWIWSEPLPDLARLPVGSVVRLSGKKLFNGQPDVRVSWALRVEAEGTDTIGGCDYPVRMVRMQESIDGRTRVELVYHLHAESGLVLGLTIKSLFTGEEEIDLPVAVK